ncbi:MAG: flagellar export chaperone FliS [Hydrogenophilus sp.]|nr:flagellar export chaperone FliS [Hydrogenophilus sp.]
MLARTAAAMYQTQSEQDLEAAVAQADPHTLILMLFDGALQRIAEAEVAIEQRNVPKRAEALEKATAIVRDGLRGSLDLDAGGELAERLVSLYDYILERLQHAALLNSIAPLEEATSLLRTLREAWAAIEARQ